MKINKFTSKKRRPSVHKAAASQASKRIAATLLQEHVSALLSSDVLETAFEFCKEKRLMLLILKLLVSQLLLA
jgi:hypothetical protein